MLPLHLADQLELLEARTYESRPDMKKIAVFDLDNTLLIGDIGEAVFAELIAHGARLSLSWREYVSLLFRDKEEAYRRIVQAMEGLSVQEVERATMNVLDQEGGIINVEGATVPVPKQHPIMKELVERLHQLQYSVYVISASNQISVRMTAAVLFGVARDHAFGISPQVINGVLLSTLEHPVPVYHGKVETYYANIGTTAPLLTAGDTLLDLPMLSLTDPEGLSVWVGRNRVEFEVVKGRVGQPQRFCFVQRPDELEVKEERPYAG